MRLQTYAAEHVAAVHAFLSDPEVLAFTPVPEPVPDDHAAGWLARFDAGRREGSSDAWVVLEDDTVLGFACAPHLSRTTGDLEIGYIVSPGARRRGVATWVLGELTTWAFGWGAERVELNINADNAGSRCVAERCGYVLEGTRRSTYLKPGRRVDTTIWSRLGSDPKTVEAPGRAAYGQGTSQGRSAMSKDKQGREAKKPKKGKAVATAPKPVIPQSPRA